MMLAYMRAAWLKEKRSFHKVLIWMMPLITILLAGLLMGNMYLQAGAYNWWYTLLLPGCFTMICAFIVTKEKRKNRHGWFGIVICKKKLWLAELTVCTGYLWAACLYFFLFVTLCGVFCGQTISVTESLSATILLGLTFAWQIPLWMWLAEKVGAMPVILVSIFCNFVVAILCATERFWWIPFAIPARLMSACVHILPNGLPTETGSILADKGVILPGIMITVLLYILLSVMTSFWFEKSEV